MDEDISAPTNCVGSGAVAGVGIGKQGEPGIKKKPKVLKRIMPFREFLEYLEQNDRRKQ